METVSLKGPNHVQIAEHSFKMVKFARQDEVKKIRSKPTKSTKEPTAANSEDKVVKKLL